jgi:hypothetical protein
MTAKKSIYLKLTGRRRGIFGFTQLWIAADHILLVTSSRFVEQYKRFAFADIQAIVITSGPDRFLWQLVALTASVVWTLLVFAVSALFAKWFFGITGAIALGFSIADIARGPRCRCHLETAVSRELLPPVCRIRAAQKFLNRLRPAIESVQGALAPEQAGAIASSPDAGAQPFSPPEIVHQPGYLPEVLFGLFLVNAILFVLSQRLPAQVEGILPTTVFGEVVIVIVALIRRSNRDPRRVIYALMVLSLLLIGWDAFAMGRSFFGYMGAAIEQSRHASKAAPPSIASWLAFDRTPEVFAATWRTVIGIAGLVTAVIERPPK